MNALDERRSNDQSFNGRAANNAAAGHPARSQRQPATDVAFGPVIALLTCACHRLLFAESCRSCVCVHAVTRGPKDQRCVRAFGSPPAKRQCGVDMLATPLIWPPTEARSGVFKCASVSLVSCFG